MDTGRVRPNNEDRYCAILPPNTPVGIGGVLAVADGVGGHRAGEVASQMAVDGVARLLGRNAGAQASSQATLEAAIREINDEVHAAAADDPSGAGMGTTLSVAVVEGEQLSIGHVGDSRVYLYRDGSLTQLTSDHSWVAEEVARGAITPEQAETHPRRNIITRAVGPAEQVEPATSTVELLSGDTVMLCSDGLYGMVAEERIAAVLESKTAEEAVDVLVEMANTAGGVDNISVIVARVLSTERLPDSVWTESAEAATVVPASRRKRSLLGRLLRR